ncbi:MAG: DMT family transporter [bacterium]|nr:DMT family transporter [bacterium]
MFSTLLVDLSLESLAPPAITWVRLALGFLVLAAFPVARRPVESSDRRRVLLLGLTWIVPFVLVPAAQQHIDSALAGMLIGLVPIFSASIAAVMMRSLPRLHQVAGIAVGFAGGIVIGVAAAGVSSAAAWGVLLMVLAALFYGVALNLAVPLQQRYGAPAVMMRAMGVAAVATTPFGLFGLAGSQWSTGPVVAVATLGVINTGAAFVIMTALVGRVGAARGGVAVYFIPIVAIILGMIFRSEVLLPAQSLGIGLVLLGAFLAGRRES